MGCLIMLKNSSIIQARQHPTLCLLNSEWLDGARLLKLCRLIARMPSLFVPQFVSSAVNLIPGIEIQNVNGFVGHK